MRLAWALLLLATAARGQDLVAEVRNFIDAHRSEDSRRVYKAVVPVVPEAGDDPLVVEYRIGNHLNVYTKLSFVARQHEVDLVRVRVNARDPGFPLSPFFKPGLEFRRATIPHAAYDALRRKIDLLHGAYLEHREGVKEDLAWSYRAAATGRGKLFLRLGDRVLVDTWLTPIPPKDIIHRDLGERETAVLLFRLVGDEVSDLEFTEVGNRSVVGALLLENLAEVTGWRRILRAMALAYLGHAEALPVLRKLEPQDAWVRGAFWMIRLPQLCESADAPPEQLLQLVRHTGTDWGAWAEGFLAQRYPKHYGRIIVGRFDSEDPAERRRAIERLEQIDPGEMILARKGLDDPSAQVRVEAARILRAWEVLLAIARDKALVDEGEFISRQVAMGYLSWLNPPRGGRGWVEPPGDRNVVGAALIGILLDDREDATIRTAAARALGHLGFDQAIPTLLKILARPGPAEPVQLERESLVPRRDPRLGAAEALGELRAARAVDPLIRVLRDCRPHEARDRHQRIGLALAKIGDPRALPVLRRMREGADRSTLVDWWERCVELLEAIQRRDAEAMLRHVHGSSRFTSRLLADVFDVEELRTLAKRKPVAESRRIAQVERAIALRQAGQAD